MMKVRLLALGSAVWIASPLFANEPIVRNIRVTAVVGQVTLIKAADPKHPQHLGPELPVRLGEGDILDTGPHSYAKVMVDRETIFQLQPLSRLKPKKLFARNTQIDLPKGLLLAKVRPPANGASFILKMPNAVVAIHSAEFAAETGSGLSQVGVFAGHVIVAGAWGHEHVKLGPQMETKVTLSAVPQIPHKLLYFKSVSGFFLKRRTR